MVITVECPSCASTFPVDSAKIPAGGVKARCSSCAAVFRIEKPVERTAAPPPPPDPEVVTPSVPTLDDPEPAGEALPGFDDPEPAGEPLPSFAEPAAADEPLPGFDDPEPVDEPLPSFAEPDAPAAAVGDADARGTPATLDELDSWVIETEESPVMPGGSAEPVGTVEQSLEAAADETSSFFGGGLETNFHGPPEAVSVPEPAAHQPEPEPEPVPEAVPEPAPAEAAPIKGFTFGKRDPKEKARRLARVLVSDMISYNPGRHQTALANGTLKEDFEEEIEKSWKEYVEQVGDDMAGTDGKAFWRDALNDVLAQGKEIF